MSRRVKHIHVDDDTYVRVHRPHPRPVAQASAQDDTGDLFLYIGGAIVLFAFWRWILLALVVGGLGYAGWKSKGLFWKT